MTTQVFGQSAGEHDDAGFPESEQQQQQEQRAQQQQPVVTLPGKVGGSSVGRAGERQTREDVAPDVFPSDRLSSRLENRIQSRIRNRIDRDYDPQVNAASPYATADERQRATGR